MTNANSHWHVVQTHSRAEEKAAVQLLRQGYDIYLPRYLKRRRHARRCKSIPAPLFPRYLFVSFDRQVQRWRSIQSTIGVSQLVCNGEAPASVPEEIFPSCVAVKTKVALCDWSGDRASLGATRFGLSMEFSTPV
jgi:transcriptional antiterminator RfaH